MNRLIRCFLAVLLVSCIPGFAVAQDAVTRPPTALRWDSIPTPQSVPAATTGPAPTVYNLRVPVTAVGSMGVDDSGRCYVLDSWRQQIVRFTQSGEVDKIWLEDTGHSRKVQTYDMVLLSGERIFVASGSWLPIIRKFGPDPEKTESLPGVEFVQALAAAEDGSYYLYEDEDRTYRSAGSETKPTRIHAYLPNGTESAVWDTPKLEMATIGPDKLIYASARKEPKVIVYDSKGSVRREIDLSAAFEKASEYAIRIAVDRNGDIYCAEGRFIVRYDSSGRPLARWVAYCPPSPNTRYRASFGEIAVRNGLIYVTTHSFPQVEIQAYTPDGQCIARYLPHEPETPLTWAVAAQSDGSSMMTQTHPGTVGEPVKFFDPSGKQTDGAKNMHSIAIGVCARPAGGFYFTQSSKICRTNPNGGDPVVIYDDWPDHKLPLSSVEFLQVAVDPTTGNLLALSSSDKWELWIFGPDEKFVKRVPLDLDAERWHFDEFLAVDTKGFIYIAQTNKHIITKYDKEGKLLATYGKLGNGLGELRRPKGITVDSQGRILVADCRNCRVQVFGPDGTPFGVWGKMGSGDGELNCPSDVEVAPNGFILITDTYNDRLVRVPAADFWKQITRDAKPAPVVVKEPEPAPAPGSVTVTGIVVAGNDDLSDCVYIESADRAWGMRASLPAGVRLVRGDQCKITGQMELGQRGGRHLKGQKAERLAFAVKLPAALGMANLYVGDGYRGKNESLDLSNQGMLIKTWGRVVSVNPDNDCFMINDGSFADNALSLIVYVGNMNLPMTDWPEKGRYVIVTGISASQPLAGGGSRPAIRMRTPQDLEVMAE